ncbi:MAG: hypothetical protein ACI92G_002924 [Candidatus Pelagisphaera sp.]
MIPLKYAVSIFLIFIFSFCGASGSEAIDFNRDVRPILSDKCFFCHGPDSHEREADLMLHTAAGAYADLGGYAAIVPGDAEASELLKRIKDSEDPMPPEDSHKSLSPDEVETLSQWIADGAEYSAPWTYEMPVEVDPPRVSREEWPVNPVDRFVLSRLEAEGLNPSPDADNVTLIRRLYFDLIGLPPTPEEAAAFVEGRKTLENVVDELLASSHFGERMAMYWLDLVRYADTVGYHGDQDHNISPYRDYVIRSLNENMPFDRFTREQLAGDLLEEPTKWQKVASGYNRLLQTSHEGGIQEKEYNAIYAADRVRNVSAVWMGATIGCAQCHDHKFDPYTTKDHYSMAAFFADIHDAGYNGNDLPTNRPPEMLFLSDDQELNLGKIREDMKALAGLDSWKCIEVLNAEKSDLEESLLIGKKSKKSVEEAIKILETDMADCISEENRSRWLELVEEEQALLGRGRRTMVTVAEEPRTMRVLPRGNWQDDTGEIVAAGVPGFLGVIDLPEGQVATRLDLANWLTDPEEGVGGLTARVFANRFWYLFFGSGISSSLSDFGGQGQPPVNPELLDYLAVSFYENDWDLKRFVRLLVTSRAYRQSSVASPELLERDPYNQLVARQSRYRLPAEMVRDNALAVSQLLVTEFGGNSVKPYQPEDYYRHLNFPERKYASHVDDRQWRRGVYVHWQRMFLHPTMKTLDAPSREECTAERSRSNTPNAALALLNDPTFVEAARVLAERIIKEGGSSIDDRLDFAYQVVLTRSPDEDERVILRSLLQSTEAAYREDPDAAKALVGVGLAKRSDSIPALELASWTAVARGLVNLNEAITRN